MSLVKPQWSFCIVGHDEIEVLRIVLGLSSLFLSDDWALNFPEKWLLGNVFQSSRTNGRPLISSTDLQHFVPVNSTEVTPIL